MLEVLISMFVLLIGLMSVAALLPAGRYQIVQGDKIANASLVSGAAFHDIRVHGYLNPTNWLRLNPANSTQVLSAYTAGSANPFFVFPPFPPVASTPLDKVFAAIDPLGLAANTTFTSVFPFGAGTGAGASPIALTRIFPHPQVVSIVLGAVSLPGTRALADPVFRGGDDLVFTPDTTARDVPPIQRMFLDTAAIPNNLKRASEGTYSWLTTIVTDPTSSAVNGQVTVSVAVFYKRDLSNPATAEISTVRMVSLPGGGASGGEVVFYDPINPTALKLVKPGQYIMLAGYAFSGATQLNYFRWYRVTSATEVQNITASNPWAGTVPSDMPNPPYQLQAATLQGADWIAFPASATASLFSPPANTSPWPYVWIFDNIVAVYERNMRLEIP